MLFISGASFSKSQKLLVIICYVEETGNISPEYSVAAKSGVVGDKIVLSVVCFTGASLVISTPIVVLPTIIATGESCFIILGAALQLCIVAGAGLW